MRGILSYCRVKYAGDRPSRAPVGLHFRVRSGGDMVKESRPVSRYLGLRNLEYIGAGFQYEQDN